MVARVLLACAMLIVPASASAGLQTFGSSLSAPATIVHEHQADTAFWAERSADPVGIASPAPGQVREVRLKGIALRRPDARSDQRVGGETMIHFQVIHQVGGAWRVRSPGGTSGAFYVPTTGSDQQITVYRPDNLCIQAGDRVVFNTVGGFDGVGSQPTGGAYSPMSPYPMGTPLRVFASVPGARTSWYEQANGTDNGETLEPGVDPHESDKGPAREGTLEDTELLMQSTLATGDDRSYECGGPNTYRPADPTEKPRDLLARPAAQTLVVKSGWTSFAVTCGGGLGSCSGSVRLDFRHYVRKFKTVRTRGGRLVRRQVSKRIVSETLGRATFRADSAKTVAVSLVLEPKAKTLIKARRTNKLKLRGHVVSEQGGSTVTRSRWLGLK